jgi:hypothetical protein
MSFVSSLFLQKPNDVAHITRMAGLPSPVRPHNGQDASSPDVHMIASVNSIQRKTGPKYDPLEIRETGPLRIPLQSS